MFMITRLIYIAPYINIIGAIWYSIISNVIYDYLDDNRLLVREYTFCTNPAEIKCFALRGK